MVWYYKIGDTEHGPVSQDEIASLFKDGKIDASTRVKEDDSFAWSELGQSDIGKELGLYREVITDVNNRVLEVDVAKTRKLGWRYIAFLITSFLFMISVFVSAIGSALIISQLIVPHRNDQSISAPFIVMGLGIFGIYVMLVIGYIFYALFMHQATRNIRLMGARDSSFSPLWSWLFHLIPIMSLFKPFIAVVEVYKISHRLAGEEMKGGWRPGVWWFTWLFGLIAFRVADVFLSEGFGIDDRNSLLTGIWICLVAQMALLVSATVLLTIFARIRALQGTLSQMRLADAFD